MDLAVTQNDVHKITTILNKDGELVKSRYRLYTALKLPRGGQFFTLASSENQFNGGTFEFLRVMVEKWISNNPLVTWANLISVLKEEGFEHTADCLEKRDHPSNPNVPNCKKKYREKNNLNSQLRRLLNFLYVFCFAILILNNNQKYFLPEWKYVSSPLPKRPIVSNSVSRLREYMEYISQETIVTVNLLIRCQKEKIIEDPDIDDIEKNLVKRENINKKFYESIIKSMEMDSTTLDKLITIMTEDSQHFEKVLNILNSCR